MTKAPAPTTAADPAEAARSPQEALAAPIKLERPRARPTAGVRLATLLAALVGHAGVLYWIAREPPDSMAGGRGLVLDAVNVSIVKSSVFESRDDVRALPAPAAADAVEATEGSPESKPASQRTEQKEKRAEEKKAPDEPVPAEAVVEATPKTPEPTKDQQEARKEASTAADAVGGAAARGEAPSPAKQSAPAAASPGAVREYARYVAQALAKTQPRGPRGPGAVKVKLVLSTEGALSELEILKSSGQKRLDDIALAAVRRTKFPRPPPGLAFKERWYEFTYTFR